MPHLLDITAALVLGLLVGNEFAIAAFVHPSIKKLDPESHLGAAQPIASVLGRVMPFWYALGLILLLAEIWTHWSESSSRSLLLVAAALWAIIIGVTITLLVPRNSRIASANPKQPYGGWQRDRQQWDRLHRARVLCVAFVFVLFLLVVLRRA